MSDTAKFEAFKKNIITENEKAYGKEIREKYGDTTVDAANRRIIGLTMSEYDRWSTLGDEIRTRLADAVKVGLTADSAEGEAIAQLHREWLSYSWEKYSPEAHAGLVTMYPEDERFRAYYDTEIDGCAAFLRDAVLSMLRNP